MAVLPNDDYLIQLIGENVILFHRYTEEELVRFNIGDPGEVAIAQRLIHELTELDEENKAFAHFWSGYFYGSGNAMLDVLSYIHKK